MSRHVVSMTIDDVEHYSDEEKARIIASYPTHEREARSKGIPTMGSGKIFPVTEESITVQPIQIPRLWKQINGLDFGYDHPFACVNIAYDADSDCVYICKEYRQREATPVLHAAAIKPWGDWIPSAWPHDGFQHDKGSGEQLAQLYRDQGLKMLDERSTHEEGGNGVEAGLTDMLDRMQTGRLKVFSTCVQWFEEFRLYHRKKLDNGRSEIVKQRDDLMSATRYAIMMLRFAKVKPQQMERRRPNLGTSA